ncbi:unnamed protein product [Prunus armeniaca]
MTGLTKPTSRKAFVEGLDIRTQMDGVYSSMGVCPQHDLLWEILTGREHLMFYGRLKNLKGSALTQVVYMDEPSSSTGLDPASRKNLWNVMKCALQDRAIILTSTLSPSLSLPALLVELAKMRSHSMEEAEVLCDRVGIFVDGSLQCLGNPKELIARYGGSYAFIITTSSIHEENVEKLVQTLSPNANKIYHVSGTQKFELPKTEIRIADIFKTVEIVKSRFTIYAST